MLCMDIDDEEYLRRVEAALAEIGQKYEDNGGSFWRNASYEEARTLYQACLTATMEGEITVDGHRLPCWDCFDSPSTVWSNRFAAWDCGHS